ncbi:MAG: hypothetical protein LBP39_00610 [Rickettsiales bacterium]|jgi:hypothetical protein|nr:hypothetical protein [Rickettsiales bacterium]
MEDKNNELSVYNSPEEEDVENKQKPFVYPDGYVFKGELNEQGKPFKGTATRNCNGDVYEYEVENGERSNICTIKYRKGNIYRGKLDEHGNLSIGEMIFTDGYVFKGEFRNGELFDGTSTCKDENGQLCRCEFENGKPFNGMMSEYSYKNGAFFTGIVKNGKFDCGTITYTDGGNLCESKIKNGKRSINKYRNGDMCEYNFNDDGQSFISKIIFSDGDVYEFPENGSLDISVKIQLSKTGKSHCLFSMGKNNLQKEVEYHLGDSGEPVTINYTKINEMLNGKDSGINNLDDLIKRGAIKGVGNFNELKEFAKKVLQDKMSRGIEEGFDGGHGSLGDLLLLSSIDTVEQLRKTRFHIYYTKGGPHSFREDCKSLKDFLKTVGIDNTNNVKEDYISLRADVVSLVDENAIPTMHASVPKKPQVHAVSVILDIKKMKELMVESGKNDLDEAIANEKVIHCYDSSRVLDVTMAEGTYYDYSMGALAKNCDFINLCQHNIIYHSTWFHAVAATLTALKYPELVQKIRSGEIKPYGIENNDRLGDGEIKSGNPLLGNELKDGEIESHHVENNDRLGDGEIKPGNPLLGNELKDGEIESHHVENNDKLRDRKIRHHHRYKKIRRHHIDNDKLGDGKIRSRSAGNRPLKHDYELGDRKIRLGNPLLGNELKDIKIRHHHIDNDKLENGKNEPHHIENREIIINGASGNRLLNYDHKLRNIEIEPYGIENYDELNEFQLEQMKTIVEMAKKFDIGVGRNGEKVINVLDVLTDDEMIKKLEETLSQKEVVGSSETFANRQKKRINSIFEIGHGGI